MIIQPFIRAQKFKPLDNEKLIKAFKDYLNTHKCCPEHGTPKCEHPPEQSAPGALNIEDEEVKKLKKIYFDCLKEIFGDFTILKTRSWILFCKKGDVIPNNWHIHYENVYRGFKQISGICYLTKTQVPTQFQDEHFLFETRPKLNHWYTWPSEIFHRPKTMDVENDRMIIAADTVIH